MDNKLDISQIKAECPNGRCVGRSNNNANANGGVAYSNANNASTNSNANDGSRLTLRYTSGEASSGDHRHTTSDNGIAAAGGEGQEPRQQHTGDGVESGNITGAPEGAQLDYVPFSDIPDFEPISEGITYPIDNLIEEIISDENLSRSFDYVISHLEHEEQRIRYRPKKERYIRQAKKLIGDGSYRIRREAVKEIEVHDGNKTRKVQVTTVFDRFCGHSIMCVVEVKTYPSLIKNAAASVKGRGTHWLHHIIEDDINAVPDMCEYYCQTDIEKFYDNIDQNIMKQVLRCYISDKTLLPILDDFVTLLPQGLSKGLRSSQVYANLYMTPVDYKMIAECEQYVLELPDGSQELRFLYARYMDDAYWWSHDKKLLWHLFEIYKQENAKRKLKVKPSAAIRPLSEGFNALGYVTFSTDGTKKGEWSYSLVRKRIKKKFALRMKKVKSRKRRQQLIGSFKGVADHANARHLMKKLFPRKTMAKFSELGLPPFQPKDGKKRFNCEKMQLGQITNRRIEILDYDTDIKTQYGSRYLVLFHFVNETTEYKFFTDSEEMKFNLDAMKAQNAFPVETTIKQVPGTGGLRIYKFT